MKKSLIHKLLILLFILPALACGLLGEDPTPTPEPTDPPPTETQAPPTDTPVPPTETPVPPTDTPEPSPTPDITADFVTFDSPELGLSVQHPPDWAVDDFFILLLATDEEIFDAPGALEEGAVMVFIPETIESLGSNDPVELVNESFAEFDLSEDAAIVDGPNPVTIQGQEAAIARIEGTSDEDGQGLVGLVIAIVNGDNAAIGLGFTPQVTEEAYLPTIEAIMNTVIVSEPEEFDPETPGEPPVFEDAVMLSVGDNFASFFEENSARIFFFDGQAGVPITIDVEPIADGLDLELEIFDADQNSLVRVDDTLDNEAEQVVFTPPADGQYFLHVADFFGLAGSFSIAVTAGEAQAPTDLTPLVAGEVTLGRLDGEPVSYLVSGSAGVPATVFLVPEEDLDVTLTILGTDGAVLAERVDDGFSGEAEAITFTPDSDSDLVVTVDGFGAARGGFTIFLIDPEVATTIEGTVPQGGEQTYRICVPANASPVVFVDPEEDFDAVVSLSDADGNQLGEEVDQGFPGEPEPVVLPDDLVSDTDYAVIITVDGFGGQGGNFTIIITSTSPDGVVVDGC